MPRGQLLVLIFVSLLCLAQLAALSPASPEVAFSAGCVWCETADEQEEEVIAQAQVGDGSLVVLGWHVQERTSLPRQQGGEMLHVPRAR